MVFAPIAVLGNGFNYLYCQENYIFRSIMEGRFETFTVLLTKINRSIHKIKTEEMAEFNLKSPHVSCLYYLYRDKTLTAKELSDICEEDKASISRSIDYLEKNGFITCSSMTVKRYKAPLLLTEKGEEVARRISDKIEVIIRKAGEGLDAEKRRILYEGLDLISNNLDRLCENY